MTEIGVPERLSHSVNGGLRRRVEMLLLPPRAVVAAPRCGAIW